MEGPQTHRRRAEENLSGERRRRRQKALDEFDASPWGRKYPAIAQSWRRNWEHVTPFFAFPEAVRRIIYTTNAIESLNAKLRRAVRTRGHFPTDEAAIKLLYLVLRQVAREWKMPPLEWVEAKTQFAIMFDESSSSRDGQSGLAHKLRIVPADLIGTHRIVGLCTASAIASASAASFFWLLT